MTAGSRSGSTPGAKPKAASKAASVVGVPPVKASIANARLSPAAMREDIILKKRKVTIAEPDPGGGSYLQDRASLVTTQPQLHVRVKFVSSVNSWLGFLQVKKPLHCHCMHRAQLWNLRSRAGGQHVEGLRGLEAAACTELQRGRGTRGSQRTGARSHADDRPGHGRSRVPAFRVGDRVRRAGVGALPAPRTCDHEPDFVAPRGCQLFDQLSQR